MKKKNNDNIKIPYIYQTGLISVAVCLLVFHSNSCVDQNQFTNLKGPYLDQTPPGEIPKLFVPNIASTDKDEINAVFSPDGKTFYFSRDTYSNLSKAGRDYTIYYMKETDTGWTKPEKVPFAGEYMNADMALSFDGSQLFFCSDRPLIKGDPRKEDADIWVVDVLASGWSEPRNLGTNINSDENEWYPCPTKDGTLYFSSSREGGHGKSDLYRSKRVNGFYQRSESLKGAINTQYREGDVFIAPDESYLIVVSSDRPDTIGRGDLYISFRTKNDEWAEAINMGKTINSNTHDYCPMLSPDAKYLFFTSKKRGNDDIYWVDAKVIDELKPDELK